MLNKYKLSITVVILALTLPLTTFATDASKLHPKQVNPVMPQVVYEDCQLQQNSATAGAVSNPFGGGYMSITSAGGRSAECPHGYVARSVRLNADVYGGYGSLKWRVYCCRPRVTYPQ